MPPKRIIVVEDDDTIRDLYVEILTEEGYEAIPACNGREAIEILKNSTLPALMLTDFLMPDMNGAEMIDRLMRENRLNFPVLMVSATLSAIKVNGQEIDVLRKPMNVEELLHRVHKHCGPSLINRTMQ